MGNHSSLMLRQDEIAAIQQETGFTPNQIERLYSRFTSLDKGDNGFLCREDFHRIPELAINPLGMIFKKLIFKFCKIQVFPIFSFRWPNCECLLLWFGFRGPAEFSSVHESSGSLPTRQEGQREQTKFQREQAPICLQDVRLWQWWSYLQRGAPWCLADDGWRQHQVFVIWPFLNVPLPHFVILIK